MSEITVSQNTPGMQLLAEIARKTTDPQAAIEISKQIVELQVRMEQHRQAYERFEWEKYDREAKVEFAQAFKQFKVSAPKILKTKNVSFGEGAKATNYSHVELDKACDLLIPALLKVGITHRWKPTDLPNGWTRVQCFLRHENGYEEEGASLAGPADSSGGKNPIQGVGSSTSYLERYTLLASCGLVASNTDNDGAKVLAIEVTQTILAIMDASTPEEVDEVYKPAFTKAHYAKDEASCAALKTAKNTQYAKLGVTQ